MTKLTKPRVLVYCDESGAKGPATIQERVPGEIGVYAGLFLEADVAAGAAPRFDAAAASFAGVARKVHISELPKDDQPRLRDALFELIRTENIPCFWSAVHVQGFYERHRKTHDIAQNLSDEVARHGGRTPPRLRQAREDLIETLFESFLSRIVAYLIERGIWEASVELRMDRTEAHIKQLYQGAIERLLRPAGTTHVETVTQGGKKLTFKSTLVDPSDVLKMPQLPDLKLVDAPDSDGLCVAADALAHSLRLHFDQRPEGKGRFADLNSLDAVLGHPLADQLATFNSWPTFDFDDRMYAHPREPKASSPE